MTRAAIAAAALSCTVAFTVVAHADEPAPPRDPLVPPPGGPRAPIRDGDGIADEAPEDGVPPPAPPPPSQAPPPPDSSPHVLISRGIGVASHLIRVRIDAGTVWVTESLRIRGERAGNRDGRVRIPLPAGAIGVGASPAPARLENEPGQLVLRPGPVRGGEERVVNVTWLARARRVGASWRWTLSARPEHMRMAEPQVEAPGLEIEASSESGWRVRGSIGDGASVLQARGATTRSTSVAISFRPAEVAPRDVVIAVDASVSMDAARRLRALQALWSLADALPRGSTLRTLMYGATAEALDTEARAPDAGDGRFAARRIASAHLGAVTRPGAALALARQWLDARGSSPARRGLVVLLTDGGVYAGDGEIDALRETAAALGSIEVSVVDLARAPSDAPSAELARIVAASSGAYVPAGHVEDEDVGGEARRILAPLRVAAGAIWIDGQRVATPPLRAGDTWSSTVERPAPGASGRFDAGPIGRALPALRSAFGRASGARATASLASLPSFARSPERRIEAATSIPQDILRDALRSSLLGPARRCFRADRAGRRRYAAHVRVDLLIAEGELHSVRVVNEPPERASAGNAGPSERLLSCLAEAATALDVPRANVWLEVRYPLVVRPEAPDTVTPLSPRTTRALDGVLGDVDADPAELLRRP